MSAELAVVGGLGVITFILIYMSFNFWNRPDNNDDSINAHKILGFICFILTVVFVNIIMYTLLLIAQNSSMTYLNDTTLLIGLQAVMWATLGSLGLYIIVLFIGSGYFIVDIVRRFNGGRQRRKSDP